MRLVKLFVGYMIMIKGRVELPFGFSPNEISLQENIQNRSPITYISMGVLEKSGERCASKKKP